MGTLLVDASRSVHDVTDTVSSRAGHFLSCDAVNDQKFLRKTAPSLCGGLREEAYQCQAQALRPRLKR